MIHLEHVNLVVENIERSLNFYQAAFPQAKVRGQGTGSWYGKPRHWLHFGDDYNYIALSDNGEGNNRDLTGHNTGLAHFAFVVNNLDALVERMKNAGFSIDKQGDNPGARRNVYYIDPDGFEVEFVSYQSDIVNERNSY